MGDLGLFGYEVVSILSKSSFEGVMVPYGIYKLGVDKEWEEISKGEGVRVAVLDTGKPEHSDFKNNVGEKNFTNSDSVYDRNGHHTHVAGTVGAKGGILGVLPDAELLHAKVLGDEGSGSDRWVADAVEWAVSNDADVINMSLGGFAGFPSTHEAIKEAVDSGVIVVAAAGNSGKEGVSYPASYEEVIAVAAVNIELERPDFSAVGKEVEVAGAGYEVLSTWLDDEYSRLQGTSMACPLISGAVGAMQAKAKIRYGRKLNLDEIRLLLHMMSKPIGDLGRTKGYGYGVFSFGYFDPEGIKDFFEEDDEMYDS